MDGEEWKCLGRGGDKGVLMQEMDLSLEKDNIAGIYLQIGLQSVPLVPQRVCQPSLG